MKKTSNRSMSLVSLFCTIGAHAFYHILRLFKLETFGDGHLWDAHVRQAECPMANTTRQMHMTLTMARVVEMADAILLRPRPIIDVVKQMGIGQERQRAEQRRAVDRRQRSLQIGKTESVAEPVSHLTPDEQPHGRHTNTSIVEHLLVGNVMMHVESSYWKRKAAKPL